ncbi:MULTISPECIES: HAD family hydrolase [unclassified Schlesneria]|uniref:HAD family hydrolase n=1 Tax=unclassified Schlesneria TaxID=2762017 RepID=UPI002EE84157
MNVFLFDIDGTLIDAGGAGQAAMEQSLAEEFGAAGPVSGIPTAGRTDRAIAMDLFKFHGIDVNDDHWDRYLKSYFRLLPNSLKTRPGTILPGVPELLQSLSTRDNLHLGLLTGNFAEGAKLKLAHYGLSHHFSVGGYGDLHLDRDDVARTAWQLVQSRHPHVEPDRVWVIGDTPSDIRCARAIGAKVLAVATGIFSVDELEPHQPDLLLDDLRDVTRWLAAAGLN